MTPRTLEELKTKLIFQNTMNIWIVLCRENGWERRDYAHYAEFIKYLHENEIQLKKAPQGHPVKDFEGKPIETYTIKIDKRVIEIIRSFV
ncbi:MAG: hypothetical protein FJ358_01870 [Thaumarchaeota archaeon]|nr:hypothetical protein [Nitrososphaerota archaeon]